MGLALQDGVSVNVLYQAPALICSCMLQKDLKTPAPMMQQLLAEIPWTPYLRHNTRSDRQELFYAHFYLFGS